MNGKSSQKQLLWWGRFDPDYSRNRIIRKILIELNYAISDFRPHSSFFGQLQSLFTRIEVPDAVWVPAFRQRDFHAARKYASRHHIPLIFDPLISAWDKAVFERKKFPESHRKARNLLRWEQTMFRCSDLIVADTPLHAQFFRETLGAPSDAVHVIPVGSEESLFSEKPYKERLKEPEILFFGSFIHLQGPEYIVAAARQLPHLRWTMLGNGPLLENCRNSGKDLANLSFEPWLPYEQLPERIAQADILLGIFGTSPKAGRVIPNKVYQALSCGRPLVTRSSAAYPFQVVDRDDSGITFVPPGDSAALAEAVHGLLESATSLTLKGKQARKTYETHFSNQVITAALRSALGTLGL